MGFLFAERTTVAPGDTLRLRVSTREPVFEVALERSGATLGPALLFARGFRGIEAVPGAPDAPWDWPVCEIDVPAGIEPGVYVARLRAPADPANAPASDARDGAALFVIRAARRSRVIVNVPLFTYHAYNTGVLDPACTETTGACLYTGGSAVTLARPGGGIGGRLWDEANVDVYDRASPRQTWAHWDAKGVAWLEAEGVEYDVCTDLDLHEDETLLEGRRLLVCFGHHEYWTDAMRTQVERFVARGGNVAFFGGNTLWFRVRYRERLKAIVRAGAWPRAESLLTGLTYRRGGGWWRGERNATGYTVRSAAHWLFAGTNLRDGDTFGAQDRLAGYECDGIAEAAVTPPGLRELAGADLGSWRIPPGAGDYVPDGRASLVIYENGGTVVNAGTVDWPRLLTRDPVVSQITTNVVRRLG